VSEWDEPEDWGHADCEVCKEARARAGIRYPFTEGHVIYITGPGIEPIKVTPEMFDGEVHDVGNGVTIQFRKPLEMA
jgi:hypothetical protein